MAWGDWVRTYVGAVRRGALDIAQNVLSTGRGAAAAAAELRARFGRLGAGIINLLIGNVGRRRDAVIRRYQRAGSENLPLYEYEIQPDMPSAYRYLVLVTQTHPVTGAKIPMSHWIDSKLPMTFTQLTERATTRMALFLLARPGARCATIVSQGAAPPTFDLTRAQVHPNTLLEGLHD